MDTKSEDMDKKEGARRTGPFYKMTRRILLAGIGAVSLAEDEMNGFVERLVERGEMAEEDARKLMREILDQREKMVKEKHQHASPAQESVTKADIDTLTARIADLARQIEDLKKSQQTKAG